MAVIDLSQLPAPQIVDVPDFETLLAERKAEFVALHPKDEQEAVIRTLELESEPVRQPCRVVSSAFLSVTSGAGWTSAPRLTPSKN